MALYRYLRGKGVILLGVTIAASIWLVVSNLKRDVVLVPVRTAGGKEPSVEESLISLSPSNPVLTEGDFFQLTCTAAGAIEVYFELPQLEAPLLSSVANYREYGRAVLTFERLELGHQATYICHVVSSQGTKHLRAFEMVVFPGEKKEDQSERETARERENDMGEEGVSERHIRRRVSEGEEAGIDEEEAAAGGVDRHFSVPVFDTMEDRARYQREKVDEFCTRHNLDDIMYKLPTPIPDPNEKNNEVYSYNRHLLLDNKHKILFCFVPKVGCTNLKLLVFVSQGIIPRSELKKSRDGVNQGALEVAMVRSSFMSIKDDQQKSQALQTHYKYVMFRNPLERLASGYRSKAERFPLQGLRLDKPHFNWLRRDIFEATHPKEYELWSLHGGRRPVNISFGDFIDYWTTYPVVNKVDGFLDEHFLMISEMCQPCRTRFDFYGNFRHFNRDAQVLVDKIGASSSDLRQGYYSDDSSSSTDQKMKLYYSTLSEAQKRAVLRKMALELEFYYTIFPEERDSHKQILGIDLDLPL